ncbi:MAG: hypothetical protein HYV27_01160 [Candidatus Hydrogenedentes bacterium]|nr:hypothetical protein [Candidatus Hydrogenedentota bacterium]
MIHAGFVQYHVHFGDWDANARAAEAGIRACEGADLLVLPELAFSGYDFLDRDEVRSLAEDPASGPTATMLRELAAALNVTLVAGYAEAAAGGCCNSAMLVTPQGAVHNYRKLHLFNREKELFLPGDGVPPVFETPAGRIGVMICFDWFFPETARCLALKGAQIVAHPSNLVLPWCQQAMFARSVENHVFSITANRIGTEDRAGRSLTFTGGSQLLDCSGQCLARAALDAPAQAIVALDPAEADNKVIAGTNHLFEERRPAMYDAL